MYNRRLLDRQTALLRHLTSEAFIFGGPALEAAVRDPDLRGMNLGQLRLEAEFSYSKRMKRIRDGFSRTAALFGPRFSAVTRGFAAACPPRTYERYPDARAFHEYFMAHWAEDPAVPAWTGDVASVEVALAEARTLRPRPAVAVALAACPPPPPALRYRRHPCVLPARCRHDVRPLFDPGHGDGRIEERDTPLAVFAAAGRPPQIVELSPEAFDLLEAAPDWPPSAPEAGNGDGEETALLVAALAAQGLLLVRDGAPGRPHG